MDRKVHLIMPMAGAGSRFSKNGFKLPKPIIEINGKPFLYWATKSIEKYVELQDITFVVLKEHIKEFEIDKQILKYFPDAKIVEIPELLNGAVLTCLEGIKQINDDLPIVFNDCDHMFLCKEFNEYCNKKSFDDLDGALLTFTSNEPKYSYAQIDENGNVTKTVEKVVVSDQAICGAYYFKNVEIFKESTKQYLNECEYNEFFVSGVYNIMAQKQMKIKTFTTDVHIPYGTPEEYEIAKQSDFFKELE